MVGYRVGSMYNSEIAIYKSFHVYSVHVILHSFRGGGGFCPASDAGHSSLKHTPY